jgi:hypothetical protein
MSRPKLEWSLADYIEASRPGEEAEWMKNKERLDADLEQRIAKAQSPSEAFEMPELGHQFNTEKQVSLSGSKDVATQEPSLGVDTKLDFKTPEIGKDAAESASKTNWGGAADAGVQATAKAIGGVLKAKAEKEALEYGIKQGIQQSRSKAQQQTYERNVASGMKNLQQLISNYRTALNRGVR